MRETHKNMNLNAAEYLRVVDHVMDSMIEFGYQKAEQDAVLAILYSLKSQIMHLWLTK